MLAGLSVFASGARAQDLFEIQVYPYETVEPRHTMVELHMNFIPSGTTRTENGVFPNHHQFHFTVEITHGGRIRPRVRAPESRGLPFRLSLSTEVGFNKHQFDPNTITLEIRPILEKEFGKWYVAVNPDFSKSFRGPDAHRGPGFEPGLKVSYNVTKILAPGFEYYAETGPISHFFPLGEQHHLIFPTLDLNVSPEWELNFGVGRGLTGSSEHWIVKWIIGKRFKF